MQVSLSRKYFLVIITAMGLSACSQSDKSVKTGDQNKKETLRVRFKPQPQSTYYYTIKNNSVLTVRGERETVKNINNTTVGVRYDITRDTSTGGYKVTMTYDKIQVHLDKGKENISDMDAANAAQSADPAERMLGYLVHTPIIATIDAKGQVTGMQGYQEIVNRIMAELNHLDSYSKSVAHQQIMSLINEGIVKKNVDQLFKVFPSGDTKVGDEWTIRTQQQAEFPLNVKTTYSFEKADEDIAFLNSSSQFSSDATTTLIMGRAVQAKIKGEQEGELQVERTTGMLLDGHSEGSLEGNVVFEGKELPVEIENNVEINGKKL